MKNIVVDYDKSIITISSAFKKKAFIPGTNEYKELTAVRHDFPEFRIEVRQFKTNAEQDRYKGLTYDYMRWYIENRDNANSETMLKALDEMIDVSKCHSNFICFFIAGTRIICFVKQHHHVIIGDAFLVIGNSFIIRNRVFAGK